MTELRPRIRKFQSGDLDELYTIDQICFPKNLAFSRAQLTSYASNPHSIAWVAEGSGGILGFVLAHIDKLSFAHVLTLDVIPEFRQRKIGTLLMNAVHRELKQQGIGTIVLEVGVRNIAAQRLYEKLNYRYLGMLPGYYNGREDAYRMARVVRIVRRDTT